MPSERAILAILLAAGASFPAACGAPSDPEAELRSWIAEAEEEAEAKDRRALMDRIAVSYGDARGNDREQINDMFRFYMLRQQSIALLTKIDDIDVQGDSAAELTLTVGMAGTNAGSFGLNADAYRFELELEKDGGEWLLIGARWGEVGGSVR